MVLKKVSFPISDLPHHADSLVEMFDQSKVIFIALEVIFLG